MYWFKRFIWNLKGEKRFWMTQPEPPYQVGDVYIRFRITRIIKRRISGDQVWEIWGKRESSSNKKSVYSERRGERA